MPTYEYRCERGHTVEVVQSFSDNPLTTCESCGGALRKVFAPVGIVFKGSGFYKTDSRSSSKAATSSSSSGSDGAAAKESSSEGAGTDKKEKGDAATPAPTPAATPSATSSPAPATSGAGSKPPRD